ncbi:MAG: RecX family transcriptional regulator [Oscillospiraceae bacterium]|jgi:regulatory protein|nr:RecX family transcriptional regulator [Oscillospiraceae bacterium]
MTTVEKLTQSKNVADRFYAKLDSGETLRVTTLLIADFSLHTGRELTDDELAELREGAETQNCRARAMRILGAKQMTGASLAKRLVELGETEFAAAEAVAWLEQIGLIDDAAYARALALHYTRKGYGERRVRDEFYKRGVPRALWDGVLAELRLESESDEAEDDEPSAECRYINSRLRGAAPDRADKKRVSDGLARRGFSWDEISAAWREYLESIANTEET